MSWLDDEEGALTTPADRQGFAALLQDLRALPPRRAVALHGDAAADLACLGLWRQLMLEAGVQEALGGSAGAAAGARLFALGGVEASQPAHRLQCPPMDDFSPLQQRLACDAVWLWELAGSPAAWGWLAALGCIDKAGRVPVGWFKDVLGRHTGKFLRLTHALLDMAVRAPPEAEAVALALELLQTCDGPRAVMAHPKALFLTGMRSEYEEALRLARGSEPYMCGRLAVYQLESRFRLEDCLATTWAAALKPRVVLVGNRFAADRVRFVVQSSCTMQALDFLRGAGWPAIYLQARGEVSLDTWHLLLRRVHVAV